MKGLKQYFPKCFCEIRTAQRLAACSIEVKIRYSFDGLETFLWTYAETPSIVSTDDGMTPEQAKGSIQPAPNVVSFDRSNAPMMHRSNRPLKVAGLAID